MNNKPPLARLERVDLRDYWEREDTDFTPWLAEEDNIALLSEAIGMELEVQDQEASVGPFRADILCRNTADNTLVLIENQLEGTNHTHLGQLFTYAAGLDAVTVIWIARQFTEEHRAALDWLNRITHDDFYFFGVEIDLFRIGNSQPAPQFSIVSKPNDWVKTAAESVGRKLTPTEELRIEFWRAFSDHLRSIDTKFRAIKPSPSHWVGYGIGRSGFGLHCTVAMREQWVAVEILLHDTDAIAYFHLLHQDKDAIEEELGFELDWQEKKGRKEKLLRARFETDPAARSKWPKIHAWMVEKMEIFDKVFRPRVQDLDASEWDAEEIVEARK